MKRLIALIVILLLGFYVGWPYWTGHQIASAVKLNDSQTLEAKISFVRVRETLRPAAEEKIGEAYDAVAAQYGAGAATTIRSIKGDVVPYVADSALTQLVTAPNLIRLFNEGGSLKVAVEGLLREHISKIGGLPGLSSTDANLPDARSTPGSVQLPAGIGQLTTKTRLDPRQIAGAGGSEPATGTQSLAATSAKDASTPLAELGLANIKRVTILDALAFELGVAQDPRASEPDVMIEMRFIGSDWRVAGVRPRG